LKYDVVGASKNAKSHKMTTMTTTITLANDL